MKYFINAQILDIVVNNVIVEFNKELQINSSE